MEFTAQADWKWQCLLSESVDALGALVFFGRLVIFLGMPSGLNRTASRAIHCPFQNCPHTAV